MRLAVQRGNCDLLLMPLGRGVFKNDPEDIKSAIYSAYDVMKAELVRRDIKVFTLTFNANSQELAFFS